MLNAAQKNITTHQAWLLDDGQGNFAGAVIPMEAPLETMNQWQAALDTIFAEAVAVDPHADINGLYSLTFTYETDPSNSGLLLTRLHSDLLTGYDRRLPHGALGLVAVTSESDSETRIAICSLTGGVTHAGIIRPNRTLCSLIDNTGKSTKPALSRDEKLSIRAIGRFLHTRLDRHLESTRG